MKKRIAENSKKKLFDLSIFSQFIIPFFLPIFFFLTAIVTISDYGMNWDSPVHFARGQAFLRYLLTGKTNYKGTPPFCVGADRDKYNARVDYKTGEVCDRHRKVRVSEYESTILDFNWAKNDTYGHPAFSDIMLAASNQIFFKWLGWFEDIDAYHLYNIFLTFLLAIVVTIWAKMTYGTFAAVITSLSVYLFPLLFGEQHFNVKDPPLAALFTLGIFLFWLAIIKKNVKLMVLSAVAGGMSFATKINYVFAPIILLPWLLFFISPYLRGLLQRKKSLKVFYLKLPKLLIISILFYPVIVLFLFFISWPALWFDTQKNVLNVIKFYQDIGVSTCPYPRFSLSWVTDCSNFLVLSYILTTVPIVTLFFFLVGSFVGVVRYRAKNFVTVLWLSFFLVTVLRVTLSISSAYGGLRQIIEIIAPMSLLAGVGAVFLRDTIVKILFRDSKSVKIKKTAVLIISLFLIGYYVPIAYTIVKLHPNQNVYYNAFIGGLAGAKEKNFSGYGNTYGNAYWQGVRWLNAHAVKNPELALVSGLGQNLSRGTLREDISFLNGNRSGYNQLGEYMMLLVMEGDPASASFRYKFLDKFLTPVYNLQVEGVSLLKIWRNDPKYIKPGINIVDENKEQIKVSYPRLQDIVIELPKMGELKRLEADYQNDSCDKAIINAPIFIATDGKNYAPVNEVFNDVTVKEITGYSGRRIFLFTGEEARYIMLTFNKNKSCNPQDISFSVYTFADLYRSH